jgi:hypothetical protein
VSDPASALATCVNLVEKLNAEIARGIKISEDRGKAARAASAAIEEEQRKLYGPDFKPVQGSVGAVSTTGGGTNASGLQGYQGNEGLNPLSEQVLDMEGFAKGSYKAGRANIRQYDMQTAAEMENYANQLDQATGQKSAIGDAFRKIAQFIREGRFGGDVAKQYAQAILFNYQAGAAQELVDPTTSNQLKALIAEFLRFESSGRLA